jgi:DNA-binding protein HU-beta
MDYAVFSTIFLDFCSFSHYIGRAQEKQILTVRGDPAFSMPDPYSHLRSDQTKEPPVNKAELVTALSAKTGLTKKSAEEALDAMLDTIADIVRDGDKVNVAGFGTFVLVERAARKARNPKTGQEVLIAPRKVPRFIPGKKFREMAK